MIDAAGAIAEAEDFSRRIGGIAPGAGLGEIAPADVPGLEIAEDDQRRFWRDGWRFDRRRGRWVVEPIPMLGQIKCRNISHVARYGPGWRSGGFAQ